MSRPLPSLNARYTAKADASLSLFIMAGMQVTEKGEITFDAWEVYSRPFDRCDAKADKRIGIFTAAEFWNLVREAA